MIYNEMFKNGFIEDEIPHGINLVNEINKLKRKKCNYIRALLSFS